MINKNKNIRITITIDKKTNDKLDFIVRNSNKTKSQIISDLIKQKTSISKLWKEIEYEDLNNSDKIYYVKSLIENKYLDNTSCKSLTDLILDVLEIIENELYQDINCKTKSKIPKYKLNELEHTSNFLSNFMRSIS